eukprot:TRINITY_DN2646_c0_g1_i2.p1 TRINITY_DN2646_c0_g1~~TRINITY_DN2646_c0_g1_i2.p1  ORF type:complete len:105 (-),score=11.18 TRINITY_DN2646_c0_g1_i2:64-378(-)
MVYSSMHKMPLNNCQSYDQREILNTICLPFEEGKALLEAVQEESLKHAKQVSQISTQAELSHSMTIHELEELSQCHQMLSNLSSNSTFQQSLLIHSIQLHKSDP